jgi:hypothetical protein
MSDIGSVGKDFISGKPAGGENTGGNNVGRDLSEEMHGDESAEAAHEKAGAQRLASQLARIAKSELKRKK